MLVSEFQTSLPQGSYCNLTEEINSTDRNCANTYTIDSHSRLKVSLRAHTALVLLVTQKKVIHGRSKN